jgi:EAL domain-containing protein (putative c-di-GMP-specific phosphodiesterase class I)
MQPGILLVDDDSFMLTMLSHMLAGMGYQRVDQADGGEKALAMIQADPEAFDVILCDVKMPSMDGIAFLQSLNSSAFQGNVILMSGEGMRIMHTVQKLLGGRHLVILGALEKPTKQESLRALLDTWQPLDSVDAKRVVNVHSANDLEIAQSEVQWVLHYQPKVSLKTGALAGVEALVRWNHPTMGLLYPDSFIELAEESGAIHALTDWVLQEALRQQAVWHSEGLTIEVAINVSMDSLEDARFASRVVELTRAAGVSPKDVMLELTESRLMSENLAPLESLVRLRLEGFGLSIDDFGTGHSSLVQLRDVPFTELKVDRGFVLNARHNQIIRPILEGSIGIAKRMGMQSVAEGVESEDDWHLLRGLGCDFAQGFFIARPMPADEVREWLASWEGRRGSLAAS